jgi:hypothetical protein
LGVVVVEAQEYEEMAREAAGRLVDDVVGRTAETCAQGLAGAAGALASLWAVLAGALRSPVVLAGLALTALVAAVLQACGIVDILGALRFLFR